jgi:UDP-N-acetylmuramyl pentapeptide phosphotransferase/UDP-N-acetylglucosamine-1-phosphate transferase
MEELLLQINSSISHYKPGLLAFVTAFIVAMITMPPLIKLIHKFQLLDQPDARKLHAAPIPTMGGIAAIAGMTIACLLWYQFNNEIFVISLFFSIFVLAIIGIMDDKKHMPANYKLVIQLAVSLLMAFSGIRITDFNGILGIHAIPIAAQYSITILAITGITNAFNLIDGIDGLAGGLGFMSLVVLGVFLTLSTDVNTAIIAFALGGGVLGFLYYNFNPARIFMGDTGSLVLGFVIAVLCIRFIQLNSSGNILVVPHVAIFTFSIVLIPVLDTLRVFGIRIWQGRSPFSPDRNHIHHLLTNNGWNHGFVAKLICGIHGLFITIGYFLKDLHQWAALLILIAMFFLTIYIFKRLRYAKATALAGSH